MQAEQEEDDLVIIIDDTCWDEITGRVIKHAQSTKDASRLQ